MHCYLSVQTFNTVFQDIILMLVMRHAFRLEYTVTHSVSFFNTTNTVFRISNDIMLNSVILYFTGGPAELLCYTTKECHC